MKNEVDIHIILVEPIGGINVGLISRLIANFEAKSLRLVNSHLDDEQIELAYKFSARADNVLDNAYNFKDLREAIKDLDLVFATSAITGKHPLRKYVTPREAADLVYKSGYRNVGIVFGRESTGLTNEEISLCDLLINIESSPGYRTLNIANSVAIILYNFYIKRRRIGRKAAPRILREKSVEYFFRLSQYVSSDPIYCERAARAFSNIINRGGADTKEIRLILGLLRRLNIYIESKCRE